MTLLDPRDHSNYKYNVHLTNKALALMFSPIKFSTDQRHTHAGKLLTSQTVRTALQLHLLSLTGDSLGTGKGHDHDYSSGWC